MPYHPSVREDGKDQLRYQMISLSTSKTVTLVIIHNSAIYVLNQSMVTEQFVYPTSPLRQNQRMSKVKIVYISISGFLLEMRLKVDGLSNSSSVSIHSPPCLHRYDTDNA